MPKPKTLLMSICILPMACAVQPESSSEQAGYTQKSGDEQQQPLTADYGFCSAEVHCPAVQQSWYPSGVGGSDAGVCDQVCRCFVNCTQDADCARPDSGSSEPVCTASGCMLPCDDEHDCPEGMACVDTAPEDVPTVQGKICAWPMAGKQHPECLDSP